MNGFEVLVQISQMGIMDDVPVIMIFAESSPSFINKEYDLGAVDYVTRPCDFFGRFA